IRLSPPERALYDDVTAFVRAVYAEKRDADGGAGRGYGFVWTLLAQRICSSSPAIARSLEALAEKEWVGPEFRQRAMVLAERAAGAEHHAKLRALDDVLDTHGGQRVVVFSEHRPTLDLIQRHVEARGVAVFPYHGGIDTVRRAQLKRRFRDTPGSVLLSSRSGAEGLNLQFAHVLVNYELPWNPLVVEQRIGRLHRIGQKRDVVIYNFAAVRTVEDRILRVLQDKIRLFELVVGELDVILGRFEDASELERRFTSAWLSAADEDDFEREVQRLEREVDESVREAREAESRSGAIAPADNAERLEREFDALTIPARVRLAYGTRLMTLAPGVEAERFRIGLAASEIQSALRNAVVPDCLDPAGVGDYGPSVWIHSVTGRGRTVSLRVAAERLPVTLIEVAGDVEAPLTAISDEIRSP
ncbi:MAG: DEAD/DEAH box helicase, partial [Myxococcales bacterium]|nr:DEAD/DEAH box helicase [Myxococcales bacterium]